MSALPITAIGARGAAFFHRQRAVAIGIGRIEPGEHGIGEFALRDRAVAVGIGGAHGIASTHHAARHAIAHTALAAPTRLRPARFGAVGHLLRPVGLGGELCAADRPVGIGVQRGETPPALAGRSARNSLAIVLAEAESVRRGGERVEVMV